MCTLLAQWPDEALPPLNIDRYTAFVALTHDPKIDDPALTHALSKDCFYIGALGSRKTHARRLERLKAQGIGDNELSRIHAPIGLRYRRGVAAGNRGLHHGRDHRASAAGSGEGGMKFGPVPPEDAIGATAVHTIRKGELVLKKGTVIDAAHVAALKAAGIADVVVARLDPGDVSEDDAAAAIAEAIAGEGVHADRAFTGRCNLFADKAGVLIVDRAPIDAMNRIDEAVTLATLPAYKPVVEGEMLATVKIIPFAVAGDIFMSAMKTAQAAKPLVRVAPYKVRKVGVVSTLLPGLSPKGDRQDTQDNRRPACARRRAHCCRAACAARAGGACKGDP